MNESRTRTGREERRFPLTAAPKRYAGAHVEEAKEWLLLILGVLVVALGIHFFKFPNHFAMGGVAGIAVVLGKVLPFFTPAKAAFVLNMLLLALGYLVFGRTFALRTSVATVLLSVSQLLLERFVPMVRPLTDDSLLELFFAIIFSALGSALLFNRRASTGGTDVLAMILRKRSSLDIGKALLLCDLLIGASTFLLFDIKTGLYSIGGILLKGVMVDSLIESFNQVKYFTIICSKPDEIGAFITNELHRGSTSLVGEGVYSKENKTVLLCVVRRYQAGLLRNFILRTDPGAFIMVTNTSEITGRGFHSMT